jgi:hypothetical protein
LIWVFGIAFGGGVAGSWGAATVYIFVVGTVLFMRTLRGRWQEIKLIASKEGDESAVAGSGASPVQGKLGLAGPLAAAARTAGGGDETLALGQPQPAGRALRGADPQAVSERTLNVSEMMDDLGDGTG